MNALSFVNKYKSFYLPPLAEKIYNLAETLNSRMIEVSRCLKIDRPSKNKLEKGKILHFSIPNHVKTRALENLEKTLSEIEGFVIDRKHEDRTVNAIIIEGLNALETTFRSFQSTLQKKKLRDSTLLVKIKKNLSHLDDLISCCKKEKTKSFLAKTISFCSGIISLSVETTVKIGRSIFSSVKAHKTAYAVSAVVGLSQRICQNLTETSKEVLESSACSHKGHFCPKPNPSEDSIVIPLLLTSFSLAFLSNCFFKAMFIPLSSTTFKVDSIRKSDRFKELNDSRLNTIKQVIKNAIIHTNVREKAIALIRYSDTVREEQIHTAGYGTLKINQYYHGIRHIYLPKQETPNQNDLADQALVMHELYHYHLHIKFGSLNSLFHSNVEALALRTLCPTMVPYLFFNCLFKPTCSIDPSKKILEKIFNVISHLAVLFASFDLENELNSTDNSSVKWIYWFTVQLFFIQFLMKYKKMNEEWECDNFALRHASVESSREVSRSFLQADKDDISPLFINSTSLFMLLQLRSFFPVEQFNEEDEQIIKLLNYSALLWAFFMTSCFDNLIHPPDLLRALNFGKRRT